MAIQNRSGEMTVKWCRIDVTHIKIKLKHKKIEFLFLEKLLYSKSRHNKITIIDVTSIILFFWSANLVK
jgi:hypothetical protein